MKNISAIRLVLFFLGYYLNKRPLICKLMVGARLDAGVIDIFCGIGGLSHGFFNQRFKILAGVDIDESCRYAFEANNKAPFIKKSVEEVTAADLNAYFAKVRFKILVGCAPCQPFSSYNREKGKSMDWKLLRDFGRLVSGTKPHVVSMENVPQVTRHGVYEEFVATLEEEGYQVTPEIVFCPDYGIPQRRKRLVLIASRLGKATLIEKTHEPSEYPTVFDAIGNLPQIRAGEASDDDPLHRSRNLTPLNMKRIKSTPEGGGWKSWRKSLRLDCHKKRKGRSFGSVYGRMSWDQPGPTITTECDNLGSGRFGHPEQDRTISIREAALLQTFPKNYKFYRDGSEITFQSMSRHIGNAVPVKLGDVIAESIALHIRGHLKREAHVSI